MEKQYRTVTRTLKWYNKLWVLIKEKFNENTIYSDELKNRLTLSRFLWEQKIIVLLLLLPTILLPLFAFFLSKQSQTDELFKINVFDVIASVLTYTMPAFLSLIVWHSSWLQKRERENECSIRTYVEIVMNEENNTYLFSNGNDIRSIKLRFTNQNPDVPIKIKFLKTYHQERGNVTSFPHHYLEYNDGPRLLEFNKNEDFVIGFKEQCLKKIEHLYFLFYVSNAYQQEVYCIIKCTIDESGWVSTIGNEGVLVERSIFQRLKKKFGCYFLREIVLWSPVGWREKMINRIHMCKKVRIIKK